MLASQAPDRIPLAFATSGTKNVIPEQAGDITNPNDASYESGFPPITMTPVASGGLPPNGADFNGILFALSALARWQSAGGQMKYSSAFANDSNVGGYPKGAVLESTDGSTLWLCLADNTTSDPDAGASANWTSLASYGIASITGLTNANVTLTPAQFSKPIITLAGTLTGNVQIILPTQLKQWTVINNCTGGSSVTVKTPSGTGVVVPNSGGIQLLYSDGTNINAVGVLTQTSANALYAAIAGSSTQTFSVGAASASAHALRLEQALGMTGYTDVTSSRALGSVYTNSYPRPLEVVVSLSSSATGSKATVSVTVTGNTLGTVSTNEGVSSSYGGNPTMISFTVPPGGTYRISNATQTSTILNWNES